MLLVITVVISLFTWIVFYFSEHSNAMFWQHASAFVAAFVIIAVGALILLVYKAIQLYFFHRKGKKLGKKRIVVAPVKKRK